MSAKPKDAELVERALESISAQGAYEMVDIGVNLADSAYDQDRGAVVERARKAGVSTLIVTGCTITLELGAELLRENVTYRADSTTPAGSDLETSQAARRLSHEHAGLYFTAGVHPHNAKQCNGGTLDALRQLAADTKCVAIGECGLDFNRNFSPQDVQKRWFEAQVRLAVELQKPLFLHNRDSGESFAHILRQHTLTAPAVAHCFTGSAEELRDLLALGLHIGITGSAMSGRIVVGKR